MKKFDNRKEYILYHCSVCGKFFMDEAGTVKNILFGKDADVLPTVCSKCLKKKKYIEE